MGDGRLSNVCSAVWRAVCGDCAFELRTSLFYGAWRPCRPSAPRRSPLPVDFARTSTRKRDSDSIRIR